MAHLVCRPLDWDLAPVEALRLVRSDAHPVALTGAWAGGSAPITSPPRGGRTPPGVPRRRPPPPRPPPAPPRPPPGVPPGESSGGDFGLGRAAAEHKAGVARAVEYIRRGDIFQANICLRLEAGFPGDPLDAFCHAVTELRPPYAAFIGLPSGAVASMSPELFLRRTGRTVLSRPIKGTRPRSPREQQALRHRAELEHSAKGPAEHGRLDGPVRNDPTRGDRAW